MRSQLTRNPQRLLHAQRESLRVGGWTPELRDYLKRHRLNLAEVTAHAGFLNVVLVQFWTGNDGDQSFTFNPDGEPTAVIEALLFDWNREPYTADLVAWPLRAPDQFTTAMGLNDGADVLGPVNMVQRGGAPLKVYRTPLAWLKAGCDGCCPLKPGSRHWLRRAGGPFAVEDVDHGLELRKLLGSDARERILVPAMRRAAV